MQDEETLKVGQKRRLRYFFLCADIRPESRWASGGTAVIYQMVAELRKQGHDAAILHGDRRARYSGAREDVPIFANYRSRRKEMNRRGRRRRLMDGLRWRLDLLRGGSPLVEPAASDVIVVAEYMMEEALAAFPDHSKILIAQNPFSHMRAHTRAAAWHPDPAGAFSHTVGISEICVRFCRLLGYRTPAYVPVTLYPERFPFRAEKEKVIAFMPRKRKDEAQVIAASLEARGKLQGYRLDPIDGMSQAEVADRMARARFFISLQRLEGLGLPAAEAMASGCVVVGYTGLGADEYFDTTTGIPIAEGDTAALVQAVEEVIAEYEDSPERLEAMRRHASEVVNRRYSSEAFLSSLIATWAQIDADLSRPDLSGRAPG